MGNSDDFLSRGLDRLARMQNADGGWGYHLQGASYVEPTAAGLMAHALLGAAAPETALGWLLAAQRADGAWAIDGSRSAPSWMTAWAVWALSDQKMDPLAAQKGGRWLLGAPVMSFADAQNSEAMRRLLDLDAALTGWPWQPGEAAWVFPTALSMLALGAVGYAGEDRFAQAHKYLLDRRCESGGWNFGNPVMLGKQLPATPPETALALMALRIAGTGVDDPAVTGGIRYLATSVADDSGGADLAWRVLGLKAWDEDLPGGRDRLIASLEEPRLPEASPFVTALALLALAPSSLVVRAKP